MVDVNDIKRYEAPGNLMTSRERIGSDSSAKAYDNIPKTPPKSSESYFQGDEEGANTDSDGERMDYISIRLNFDQGKNKIYHHRRKEHL